MIDKDIPIKESCDVQNLGALASIIGCPVVSLPISYLGLPLGASSSSKSIWNPVLKRTAKKLASWKGNFLPKGGKLVLIKSILSSLPLYFLFFVLCPGFSGKSNRVHASGVSLELGAKPEED